MPAQSTIQPTDKPVLLSISDPEPQNRLTVLFRLILALPHTVLAILLTAAVLVVTIIAWFALLITGRLPDLFSDFFAGYLQYLSRYYAYAALLTDQYPPFSLDAVDYPLQLSVTTDPEARVPGLFRFILVIPALLLGLLLNLGGLVLFGVLDWIAVFFRGNQPQSVHEAVAGVIRFQLRTSAYGLMLTGTYPAGLYGDGEAPDTVKSAKAARSRKRTQRNSEPIDWGLYLSESAKGMIKFYTVLGAIFIAVGAVLAIPPLLKTPKATPAQLTEAADSFKAVITAIDTYGTTASKCESSSKASSCLTNPVSKTIDALNSFGAIVNSTNFPSATSSNRTKLETTITSLTKDFNTLKGEKTAAAYEKYITKSNMSTLLDDIGTQFKALDPSEKVT